MNTLRYQLELLQAMNQKLSEKERMYRLVCESSDAAYIYYSFAKKEFSTLGNWDAFFEFNITDVKDYIAICDMVDDGCLEGRVTDGGQHV